MNGLINNKFIKMQQEKIKYCDVMALGFNEEIGHDSVYFKEHGFEYTMITLNLTKKIYLDWAKETQLCTMYRMDSPKDCNILNEKPIMNLEDLKSIVNFFTQKKEKAIIYNTLA